MLLRSSFSFATVRPRYSVSRTAAELWNRPVNSAHVASFVAMGTPYKSSGGPPLPPPTAPRVLTKKAPAQLRGAAPVARKNFVTPARVLAVQAFGHYLGSDNQR